MRLEQLTSPGSIPNSQKLRVELLKAINYVQLEGMKRGHGSTHVGTLSASLAAAKAAVDALVYVPVTGVTVTGAGAVAIGATRQLGATIAQLVLLATALCGRPLIPPRSPSPRLAWCAASPLAL